MRYRKPIILRPEAQKEFNLPSQADLVPQAHGRLLLFLIFLSNIWDWLLTQLSHPFPSYCLQISKNISESIPLLGLVSHQGTAILGNHDLSGGKTVLFHGSFVEEMSYPKGNPTPSRSTPGSSSGCTAPGFSLQHRLGNGQLQFETQSSVTPGESTAKYIQIEAVSQHTTNNFSSLIQGFWALHSPLPPPCLCLSVLGPALFPVLCLSTASHVSTLRWPLIVPIPEQTFCTNSVFPGVFS